MSVTQTEQDIKAKVDGGTGVHFTTGSNKTQDNTGKVRDTLTFPISV